MQTSTKIGVLGSAMAVIWPALSFAQLWDPHALVRTPNAVIAHDTSVTMRINTGCTSCHSSTRSRLDDSKVDINATLPVFQRYFNFMSYQYEGCGSAHVLNRIIPDPLDPGGRFADVQASILGATACGSKERNFPGGDVSPCITANCGVNDLVRMGFLIDGRLTGFDPLLPFRHETCIYSYNGNGNYCQNGGTDVLETVGYNTGGTNYCHHVLADPAAGLCSPGQLQTRIRALFAGFTWPRWEPTGMTAAQIEMDFCSPMRAIATSIRNDLETCMPATFTPSRATFDALVSGPRFCDANQLVTTACQPASPFRNTCVCGSTNPNCVSGGVRISECGVPFDWKTRQQVGVCEAHRTGGGTFNDFFRAQGDNVVTGGCRQNALLMFTDGYMGHTTGTQLEAALARTDYQSSNPFGNMAVFRVANSFATNANAMMSSLTGGAITTAFDATNIGPLQSNFSALLNRIYQGNYTGTSMTLDSNGTVAVLPSFVVPGYRGVTQPTDSYTGWPMRLSLHQVDSNGAISATPEWETDWTTKAQPATSCYSEFYGPGMGGIGGIQANRGPGGNFTNGVARTQVVPPFSLNRDNALQNNIQQVTLGRMFGTAKTRPVIVDRPRGASSSYAMDYATHVALPAVQNRPRMIYTMGGGYVYGIHGGTPQAGGGGYAGGRSIAFSYDHTVADAGREVIRYAPAFVDTAGNYIVSTNPIVPQPMTTGQLASREVYIENPPGTFRFRTVLVGSQGKDGRGMFSMDVTDPCAPSVLQEWALPLATTASNEPMIYLFPQATAPEQRAAVIMTGGANGTNGLYAFDIANGAPLDSMMIPGAIELPSEPVCIDVLGSGVITHCYVVSSNGGLFRAEVTGFPTYRFGGVADITPPGVDRSLYYSTRPAAFFGPDGAVNIVYGSGDYQLLTQITGGNRVYKAIDRESRMPTVGAGPADLATACAGAPGVIDLGNRRMLSPPIIEKGVVAFTAYEPSGPLTCAAGQAYLYAMNYATCADALGAGALPAGNAIGDGIPTSPTFHADSASLVASTSSGVTAAQTTSFNGLPAKGGLRPYVKRLYWRLEAPNP